MKRFLNTWNYISVRGVDDKQNFLHNQSIRAVNQLSIVLILLTSIYFFNALIFISDIESVHPMFYTFHLGVLVSFFMVILLNGYGLFRQARIFFLLVIYGLIVVTSWRFVEPFRTEPHLFGLATFVFVAFQSWKIIIPLFMSIGYTYYFLVNRIIESNSLFTNIGDGLEIRVVVYFGTLFFALFFLRKETRRAYKELKEKASQLLEKNDSLEKSNFTKDRIFSILSHDLRNPIGSLKATLKLLNSNDITDKEFKEVASELEKKTQQLEKSLDEMLVWSKAQLQGIKPKPTICTVKPIVKEFVSLYKQTARDKKVKINSSVPYNTIVYCDRQMLKSIINNLLSNAIKFTPRGGTIRITSNSSNKNTILVVQDTGVGISEENIYKLFDESVHYSTPGTDNEKGTGLGLKMCKDFVEKNEGTIKIDSQPDKGSRFIVELPTDENK